MIFAGYILYKDFEIAATYRNAVSSIKTRGFETLKDPEVYLELYQTIKIVNDWKTLTILVKNSILDVLGSAYASETTRIPKTVLKKWLLTCHF